MSEDGLSESLIAKLRSYTEAPEENLESFRSVAAKLHSRTCSQDKQAKEKTLELISSTKTGILQMLMGLLTNLDDDTAVCSVAGILHECVAPRAGKSRRIAINQLVAMNASIPLVRIVTQQALSDILMYEVLWLLAQVAQRDPKFSIKIRLLGATKAFHILLRTHYTNVKILCPLLLVLKSLTRSASTASILVKDGILLTLEKTLMCIGYTPNLKLKLALNITNYLTKTRLCCIRFAKSGLFPFVLRTFECWDRYEGKSRLKICNYILVTLQHLCNTKAGCQYIRKLNGISILHRFGTTCPEDKSYDNLLSRACHIINMCVERKQLPIDSLPSPATFSIPKVKTVETKENVTSSQPDNQQSGDEDSDDEYDNDDGDDGDSDDFGEGDDDVDDNDSCKTKKKNRRRKLEEPVQRSEEDLAGYAQFFKEFTITEEKKKKKESASWSSVVPSNRTSVLTVSYYRKRSADDMYSRTSLPDNSNVGRPTTEKTLFVIADINEDSDYRHTYTRIASRINSVLPFVKIAYPDMMVGEGAAFPEPFNVKDRRVCRSKLMACMEHGVKRLENHSRVVFDLDSLITELPQPKLVDNNEKLLFNLDESHLGQSQSSRNHLCFESRFESGNLRKAIQIGETEYDLILMPDVNSSSHHQWFYFQVSNMEQGVPYTFNIINCEKQNSQFNYGMKPLMYSVQEAVLGRGGWHRVGTNLCYYRNCYQNTMSRRPRSYLTTTFTITFPHSHDICYIAYHYPYTYSQLLAQIWKWSIMINPANIYFRADNLCLSLNNNETPVLTISAPQNDENRIQDREIIFLTARVHPGESNSSWVMHGTIVYLLSDAPCAVQLRNKYVFKIVPMLNMEGVINGCHRCGLTNEDLNRCWSRPNQYLHPIIYHTKGLMEYCVRVLKKTPVVFCDYHGHSRRKNVFFYGCSKADSWCEADKEILENPADYLLLPHLVNNLSPAFSLQQCSFQVEYGRESTARVTVWREFGVKCSYTMESSYCGFDQGPYEGLHLSTLHLREMGQHFCEALAGLHDCSFWKTGCSPALSMTAMPETSGSDGQSDCSDSEDDDSSVNKTIY